MGKTIVPEGCNTIMPYLLVKDANGFIEFMKEVFGANEQMRHMRDEHTVMHAQVSVGGSTIMLADATDDYPPSGAGMFVYVADADATYNKAISLGAKIIMEMSDQPYGRTGGAQDPYGNTWWITTHKEQA